MSANRMLLELRERAATCDNAWKKPTAIRSSSTCQSMRSAESTSYTASRMESWIKHTKSDRESHVS